MESGTIVTTPLIRYVARSSQVESSVNKSEVRQAFASRLEQALKDKGFAVNNQKSLGKLFGTSGQAVRKWLRGEALPTNARFPMVADVLEVRLAWLRDGELPMRTVEVREDAKPYSVSKKKVTPISISEQEYALIMHYRLAPPATRDAIHLLLKSLSEDN